MDDTIKHICTEVGIPRKSQLKLVEYGVCTAQDIIKVRQRIQKKELDGLREEIREKLLIVAEWVHSHPDANITEDFDEDVYDKLYKDQRWAEKYIRIALGQPWGEENMCLHKDVEQDDTLLDTVISKSKAIVMESPNLRLKCGNFDYDGFLDKAIGHFHALVGQQTGVLEKTFIIAGRTQAGKTSVKGVIQSLCGLLRIPLIILTKGVDESIDLHSKLVDLATGTLVEEKHIVVASLKDGMTRSLKNAKVEEALQGGTHGGTLVIADTKQQVLNKACKAIKKYRDQNGSMAHFALVVDEADAMFRSADRHQIFEQALQQLLDLGPSMTIMISATPVPLMMELVQSSHSKKEDILFFNLEPQDDYSGVENIKPLEIDGKKIYLDQNELSVRTTYTASEFGDLEVIYANEKVINLYDHALLPDSASPNKKGILILDVSCPRVTAKGNLKDKANSMQELYKRKGQELIVITFSGRGISVKLPNNKEWDDAEVNTSLWDDETYRNALIGTVLNDIDNKYGLDMPLAIFGYTKMCRGISFRSDKRVPTHMLLSLGRGHNTSTIVQSMGRATFNGKSVLNVNGFDSVTILTTSSDYVLCVNVQNYINHVARRMQQGDSFAAAVTGANEKIPGSADFLRHTFRELGRIKGGRNEFLDLVDVDEPPNELSAHDEQTKEKFWEHADAQKLLRSLARLRKGNLRVDRDDITDDLEEAASSKIQKTKLTALLRKFCDEGLISKDSVEKGMYLVPLIERLVLFMNPEEGEVPGPDDIVEEEDDDYADDRSHQLHKMVSNASVSSSTMCNESAASNPSMGSKESPILLDSSDDDSISSLSIATAGKNEPKMSSTLKRVTPQKEGDVLADAAESFVGNRVARYFSATAKVHFGTVKSYVRDTENWNVEFDDGDCYNFGKDDMRRAVRAFKKHQSKDKQSKPKGNDSTKSGKHHLTNIEDIPMVSALDRSKRGLIIVQRAKKRRVYYTDHGDTPKTIAKRHKVDASQIVRDNKRRGGDYKSLTQKSQFTVNSPVVLPLAPKEEEEDEVEV